MTRKQARKIRERREFWTMFFVRATVAVSAIMCGATVLVWAAVFGATL